MKRWWPAITVIVGVPWAIATQGPKVLEYVPKVPPLYQQARDTILSWYYDDVEWSGLWSSFPEGTVDMEDMQLSDTDLKMVMQSKNGEIEGAITTKLICHDIPFNDYVLLRGHVSMFNKSAEIVAWDLVLGHKTDFALLNLKLSDDLVVTVTPVDGLKKWFPSSVRIGKHPDTGADKGYDALLGSCKEEHDAFHKKLREQLGNQLHLRTYP